MERAEELARNQRKQIEEKRADARRKQRMQIVDEGVDEM